MIIEIRIVKMTYMLQDMLAEVKSHVETIGQVSIRRFLLDFEMPVIKEIQLVFGKDVQVSGCYVHFRNSLRRNLQKQKHLQTLTLGLRDAGDQRDTAGVRQGRAGLRLLCALQE
jgi:hypothetical protein